MRTQTSESLRLEDLVLGRRACISEKEYAQLKGCSVYKFQRDRYQGRGTPFQKDEHGRIWYKAADVIADLVERETHRSTNEYDTSAHLQRLAKARKALRTNCAE